MEPWSTTHTPINLLHPGFHVTFITTVISVFNVSHLQILINICDLSTVADYYKSGCRSNSMCTPQFGTATDNPLIGDLAIRAQQNLARHLCSSLATTKERAISASTELAFFLLWWPLPAFTFTCSKTSSPSSTPSCLRCFPWRFISRAATRATPLAVHGGAVGQRIRNSITKISEPQPFPSPFAVGASSHRTTGPACWPPAPLAGMGGQW